MMTEKFWLGGEPGGGTAENCVAAIKSNFGWIDASCESAWHQYRPLCSNQGQCHARLEASSVNEGANYFKEI